MTKKKYTAPSISIVEIEGGVILQAGSLKATIEDDPNPITNGGDTQKGHSYSPW